MRRLINVFIAILMFNVFWSFDVLAKEDLPKCSNVTAGSERCLCGAWPFRITCEKGTYCKAMTTTSVGTGMVSTVYSCDKTNDTFQSYFQSSYVIGGKPGCDGVDKCTPYCKYKDDIVNDCFLCPIFAVIFNTVSQVGDTAVGNYSASVVKVVVVGFAIWLAIQVLMFASSFETRDFKDLAQSIITQGFVIVLVVVILQTGVSNFFKTFISPVYETGQKMAQTMFDACGNQGIVVDKKSGVKQCANDKISAIEYKKSPHIRTDIKNGLPSSMGDSIIHTMTAMENYVRKFKAFGSGMACQSWREGGIIFPKFVLLITGGAIWVLSMLIILGVPFLMIDSVFQLGVAAALLPVAVGCFAFKSTRQYSKKVWETVLNSMFSFLFITIVVLLLMSILQVAVESGVSSVNTTQASFDDMFTAGAAGKTYFTEITKNFSWAHHGFLKLAFTFILAWAMMGMAKEFADEFASSISNTSIGSSIGTMAASTAKGMATKLGAPVGKAIGERVTKGVSKLAQGIAKSPVRAWKLGRNYFSKRKLQKLQKQGKKAEYVDWRGRKHSLEGGIEKVSTTRVGKNGEIQSVDIMRSRDITMETVTTKQMIDGKMQTVVKNNIQANSSRLNRLISDDGKVDMKLREKMLAGLSDEERKQVETAIHLKVAEKRFGSNLHDSKGAMKKEPEVISYDKDKNEMVVKIITAKGDVVLQRTRIRADGLMETEMLKADKKGNVTTLSTDGLRNRMSSARLSNVEDLQKLGALTGETLKKDKQGNISGFNNAFDDLLENDKNGQIKKQTSYSYSKRMQKNIDRGMRPGAEGYGMMSKEEADLAHRFIRAEGNEFRKAEMEINFNV